MMGFGEFDLQRKQRGGDVEEFLSVCESIADKYAPKGPDRIAGHRSKPVVRVKEGRLAVQLI